MVWNASFNVVLNALHFTGDMVVEDGGNGILESGESANLVFILNDGHDAAPARRASSISSIPT